MTETMAIPDPAGLSDDALSSALAALQAESARRGAKAQARAALADSLASIRPALESFSTAAGKSIEEVFTECVKIFQELPRVEVGITPELSAERWSAARAYGLGERVIYNGEIYESLVEGNLYSPAIATSSWKREGPADA